jgi:Ca-activated chloride channel family protein
MAMSKHSKSVVSLIAALAFGVAALTVVACLRDPEQSTSAARLPGASGRLRDLGVAAFAAHPMAAAAGVGDGLERIAPAPAAAPWAGEPDRRSGAILVSLAAPRPPDREVYPHFAGHSTLTVEQAPVSTFSVDVDTASYANVRRFLVGGRLPPADAVRLEELVNYFDYGYPEPPTAGPPIGTELALFDAPWAAGRQLLRIGLQGHRPSDRPRVHLVFSGRRFGLDGEP